LNSRVFKLVAHEAFGIETLRERRKANVEVSD
jgi:hypothetical protein